MISALQLLWADAGYDAIDIVKPYVDPDIYKWMYPARSILDSGGIISGASDWPVSTANVLAGIYQAETRKGDQGVLDASQAMPREAMFYAYTRNSARAPWASIPLARLRPASAQIWFCSTAMC